ncbi:formyltransferase family protein [Terricaulis sp.]|uniref:formyltransferase family protein n=1 Tax=Terricaulis sp. TaxID=2768686 RepID=UPI0037850BA9
MSADGAWATPRVLSVVVDTPGWFDRHAEELVEALRADGDDATLVRKQDDVREGEAAFYLSCMRITPPAVLARNKHNFVAHASDLPKDRGFSPIVWQILEGVNDIPVCLIEARDPVDSGEIYRRDVLHFQGHELNTELRERLGKLIIEMCLSVMRSPEPPAGRQQVGEPTWRKRRRAADSRLDPNQTIAAQFPLLRVVDNDAYPAFFDLNGRRYILRIEDGGPAPAPEAKP